MRDRKYARIERAVDLACLLCSRVAATVQAGNVHLQRPEDAETVRRLRCPWCGGRLWSQDERAVVVYLPLPPDLIHPRRGRPTKAVAACAQCQHAPRMTRSRLCGRCALDAERNKIRRNQERRKSACIACPAIVNKQGIRCRSCAQRARGRGIYTQSLIAALASGQRRHAAELAAALGVSQDRVRDAVRVARRAGYSIVAEGGYRLESAS